MATFYKLDVEPTLFGEWAFVGERGRIGRADTFAAHYDTVAAGQVARSKQIQLKEHRGYSAAWRSVVSS
ncbi:WGR domain-containing protein [Nitrobacter winogradskyi]|nr:WGR domain-containing protein [Nitrobacter winogradskyi]